MLQFQKNYIKMYLKSCEIFVNFIVDQYNAILHLISELSRV